jgi:hypothetical protein
MRSGFAAAIAVVAAGAAHAQDNAWTFEGKLYLWLPTTEATVQTPFGSATAELSVSDALEALDFGFMGGLEARNGPWSLMGDLVYFDLTQDSQTPFGALFSKIDVATQIGALTGVAAYEVASTPNVALDIGAGFRAWTLSADVTLEPGLLSRNSRSWSDSWVDPIVAIRARFKFDEQWFGTIYLDGGGFGVGSESTFNAIATVGYRINERWAVGGGWRYLEFDRDEGANSIEMQFTGPVFGATYTF